MSDVGDEAESKTKAFRHMNVKISSHLTKSNLQNLKYLFLAEGIPESDSEGATSGVDLFKLLEQKGVYTPHKVSVVKKALKTLGRKDLIELIMTFESDWRYEEHDGQGRQTKPQSSSTSHQPAPAIAPIPPEDKPLNQNEKVKAIVRLYLEGKLFLPRNADLEKEFAFIMGDLKYALAQNIEEKDRIQGTVVQLYTSITGRIMEQPSSDPDTDHDLHDFINKHSNPCEPFLVDVAIEVLKDHEKLKERFTKYKGDLKTWLEMQIANFPHISIVLPDLSSKSCLAVCSATRLSEDQVLLAYIIELKGYLQNCLQLDCSLLGMQKGCTIVYFSISAVDPILLAGRIQSHLTEMKEVLKFSLSYIVLIDHFVVDVESGAFEALPPSASMTQEDFHIGTEEPEGIVEALALQLSETNLERHQTPDQLDDVDVQAESDLLKDKIAEPQCIASSLTNERLRRGNSNSL